MKDVELAESKEKSNFRFVQFLFFELWSFFGYFCNVITPIFDEFFTITRKIKSEHFFIIFFSFYSAHNASSIQIGSKMIAGGVCISLVGKNAGKGYELLGQQWTTFEGCYM